MTSWRAAPEPPRHQLNAHQSVPSSWASRRRGELSSSSSCSDAGSRACLCGACPSSWSPTESQRPLMLDGSIQRWFVGAPVALGVRGALFTPVAKTKLHTQVCQLPAGPWASPSAPTVETTQGTPVTGLGAGPFPCREQLEPAGPLFISIPHSGRTYQGWDDCSD